MTAKIFYSTLCIAALLLFMGCEDNEGGNCSISCGGSGTGQPFVQTNTPFVTEAKCKEMGEAKGMGCRTAFCPPTGNSSDCYQVYP